MVEDKKNIPHNIVMENRESLTATGVHDVDSFDEQTIIAFTSLGEMTVNGNELKIIRYNADVGELIISGNISAISYSERQQVQGGFLSRLFR